MKKLYVLDFCRVEIHDDYMLSEINEGTVIQPKHADVVVVLVEKHFKNKPWVYISNRIHSYSVNPTVYLEANKMSNLSGVAIISDKDQQKNQTKLEKIFFDKKLMCFDKLQNALEWKNSILALYNHQSL
ncbi:hypothetical protein U6A24_11005 [Aquimarina gracilis]|uniref:STAS/SEC14 domain-containing protein n=1 Tax=Aquimarina gracilis TaxID=874422 RepID=A0ABU5ZVW1_9FLAO|nr:hypothetical protein [Aquimarina gracilis]MEB3345993.1 hypothetical protein [Aquimarina gracilis]